MIIRVEAVLVDGLLERSTELCRGLAAPGNAWLYEPAGLEGCRRALRPEGVLAVWSPSVNPEFRQAMVQVIPGAWELPTGSLGPRGERGEDVVYLGRLR